MEDNDCRAIMTLREDRESNHKDHWHKRQLEKSIEGFSVTNFINGKHSNIVASLPLMCKEKINKNRNMNEACLCMSLQNLTDECYVL